MSSENPIADKQEFPRMPDDAPTKPRHVFDPYQLSGTQLGNYRLLSYVGAGGMGAVYKASSPQGHVAIKILKPDIVAKFPEYAELFDREVAATFHLHHPNIVRVFDAGRTPQGYPFMVMEWLEGSTLDQKVTSAMPIDRLLFLFEQIGSAMSYAHRRKIIHLDLKPENIFLTGDGGDFIKIIDFGLARILSTHSGTTVTRFGGSLHYCSPEHFGGRVSSRSDIFSLGVMFYHMAAGTLPVGGSYIAAKQLGGPLPQLPPIRARELELSEGLLSFAEGAVKLSAKDRYQSVDEMLDTLRTTLDSSWECDAEIWGPTFNNELLQDAVWRWLQREFDVFAYVLSEPQIFSQDLVAQLILCQSRQHDYLNIEDIASLVRIHFNDCCASHLLSDLVKRPLVNRFKRILVLVSDNAVRAYRVVRKFFRDSPQYQDEIAIVSGWYCSSSKAFYPVHVSCDLTGFLKRAPGVLSQFR